MGSGRSKEWGERKQRKSWREARGLVGAFQLTDSRKRFGITGGPDSLEQPALAPGTRRDLSERLSSRHGPAPYYIAALQFPSYRRAICLCGRCVGKIRFVKCRDA